MDERTIPGVHAAIAAAYEDIVPLIKEGAAGAAIGGFSYVTDAQIKDLVHKALKKQGLYLRPVCYNWLADEWRERTSSAGKTVTERYLFAEVSFELVFGGDGSREVFTALGEGMDTHDKAAAKLMTSALKAGLQQMFLIASTNDAESDGHDGDGYSRAAQQGARAASGQQGATAGMSGVVTDKQWELIKRHLQPLSNDARIAAMNAAIGVAPNKATMTKQQASDLITWLKEGQFEAWQTSYAPSNAPSNAPGMPDDYDPFAQE